MFLKKGHKKYALWSLLVFMVVTHSLCQDINRYSISPSLTPDLAPTKDALMVLRLNWKPFAPHIRHFGSVLVPFSILSRQLKINYQLNYQELYCNIIWWNRWIPQFVYRLSPTAADAVIWVGGHLICLLMLFINQCFPSSCHITFSHSQYTDISRHQDNHNKKVDRILAVYVICSLYTQSF